MFGGKHEQKGKSGKEEALEGCKANEDAGQEVQSDRQKGTQDLGIQDLGPHPI